MKTREYATDDIAGWVFEETRQIDLVASWETLNLAYDQLRFTDELSDTARMEEFKWIVREMNKFLTRMRSTLMKCNSLEDLKETLMAAFQTQAKVTNRQSLAYQKLRQRWMSHMISQVDVTMEMKQEEEEDVPE